MQKNLIQELAAPGKLAVLQTAAKIGKTGE
jgi:hypothetical protein